MVESRETFADRLREYKRELGMSLDSIGKMAGGVSAQAVSKWMSGGNIEDVNLAALARNTNLSEAWWRYGEETRPAKTVAAKRVRYDVDNAHIDVPVFDARGSAGPGAVPPEADTVIGGLRLTSEWVRRHLPSVSSPQNLAVISAMGDSMFPTFGDGDLLLVDRGIFEIKTDAVYVLAKEDELFIKRVQRRLGGGVVIKSDNPLNGSEEIADTRTAKLHILGRVVWAWNGRRL